MELKDYGSAPFVTNIEEATKENTNYRTALWTGKNLQVTLMSNEIISALESGVDIIKVFPGSEISSTFLQTINSPIPQAKLMPSGGVNTGNITDWLQRGAVAVSIGNSIAFDTEEEVQSASSSLVHSLIAHNTTSL